MLLRSEARGNIKLEEFCETFCLRSGGGRGFPACSLVLGAISRRMANGGNYFATEYAPLYEER